MLYAVVLAGIPGNIVSKVKESLQNQFNDTHVFRAAGALVRSDDLTVYDDRVLDDTIRMATDAVFGKSKRPHGFCRNAERSCLIKDEGKASCGKSEAQSCSREKPHFLIVFYQEGKNEHLLTQRLHYAACTVKIGKCFYGHASKTKNFVSATLSSIKNRLNVIKKSLLSMKSPLFLPVNNTKNRYLEKLLKIANENGAATESVAFKREWFDRGVSAYKCRKGMLFAPASTQIRHGLPNLTNDPSLALSEYFRLGSSYPSDFQYDVGRVDGKDFGGVYMFSCRERGEVYPHGDHVNITVSDCIL